MARKAEPKPYTLTVDAEACKVLIAYDTGRKNHQWPPQPIIERIEVGLDNRGTKWERFDYRLLRHPGDTLANWQGHEQACRLVTEEAIAQAEATVRQLWESWDAATARGHHTWQWKLIATEAKRIGWPTHYATDLEVHDAHTLAVAKPDVFLWSVRPSGTWLSLDDTSSQRRRYEIEHEPETRYYEARRGSLRPLTAPQYAAYGSVIYR